MTLDTVQGQKMMNWKLFERLLLFERFQERSTQEKFRNRQSLNLKKIKQFFYSGTKRRFVWAAIKKNQWPLLSLIYWEPDLEAAQSYFSGILFGVVVFIGSGAVWAKAFVKRYSAVTSTAANGAKVSRTRRSSTRSLSTSALGLTDDSRSAGL
jgi:hypothetical protein